MDQWRFLLHWAQESGTTYKSVAAGSTITVDMRDVPSLQRQGFVTTGGTIRVVKNFGGLLRRGAAATAPTGLIPFLAGAVTNNLVIASICPRSIIKAAEGVSAFSRHLFLSRATASDVARF